YGERGPVLAPSLHLAPDADDLRLAGPAVAVQVAVVLPLIGAGHEHLHTAAEQFRVRVAEDAPGRGVDRLDDALLVDGHDPVHDGIEDGPQPCFAIPQRLLRPLALRDVPEVAGEQRLPRGADGGDAQLYREHAPVGPRGLHLDPLTQAGSFTGGQEA